MNISIGQNCLNKKPIWVYSSSPPQEGSEQWNTKNKTSKIWIWKKWKIRKKTKIKEQNGRNSCKMNQNLQKFFIQNILDRDKFRKSSLRETLTKIHLFETSNFFDQYTWECLKFFIMKVMPIRIAMTVNKKNWNKIYQNEPQNEPENNEPEKIIKPEKKKAWNGIAFSIQSPNLSKMIVAFLKNPEIKESKNLVCFWCTLNQRWSF